MGVLVAFAADNLIGGTAAGAGNLISGSSGAISFVGGGGGNRVQGNLIGTDATGTHAIGNRSGISFSSGAGNNTVGGPEPGARNVISASEQEGIFSREFNNRVQGNYIGTDITGTQALGNGLGVVLGGTGQCPRRKRDLRQRHLRRNFAGTGQCRATSSAPTPRALPPCRTTWASSPGARAIIGGTTAGAGNLISGNTGQRASSSAASRPSCRGNRIGTDVTGTRALGNGTGVFLSQGHNTVIGGTTSRGREPHLGQPGRRDRRPGRGRAVQGNRIGTDATGTAALANGGNGISFFFAENALIGGGSAAARNVISGNALSGIALGNTSSFTQIQGNFIGTNAAGTEAMGNGGPGIYVNSAIGHPTNVIGGTTPGTRNVISGNEFEGIFLDGSVAGAFRVQGNFIGTDSTGTLPLPNGGSGVTVNGGTGLAIGGPSVGARNLISGNGGTGVVIAGGSGHFVQGNYIGTDVTGTQPLGNSNGVAIVAPGNLVGGTAAGAGNVISANGTFGVLVAEVDGNVVQGNRIGTNASGTEPGEPLRGVRHELPQHDRGYGGRRPQRHFGERG